MAEWLAAGTTAALSTTTVTLADGEESTIQLTVAGTTPTSFPALAYVVILKDDGATSEAPAGMLQGTDPVCVIRGPGVYKVQRPELTAMGITTAVGVDSTTAPA